jgi:hypothetical protein
MHQLICNRAGMSNIKNNGRSITERLRLHSETVQSYSLDIDK